MTSYGAYDMELPCKNPSCKSHGSPHPNCRCYGEGFAKGGEVTSFCSKDRTHERGCEYFSENPLHINPNHSVAHYLTHQGLHNLIKMGSDNSDGALEKYNDHVKKGEKHFDKINHLFEGKLIESQDHTKSRKAIHEWMARGGITQDIQEEIYNQNSPHSFADGGDVKKKHSPVLYEHPINHAYPEQNMMLQAAKGRMSNYLNTLKPQENAPKLAFDHKPDDREQQKSYQKALHIAAHPLSVLEKIQKGTIEPEDVRHLKSLHPEVDDVLQKKVTERIIKDQLEHKRPSSKVRQGLSLLLGAPLSSEMTPSSMQAIQATFQAKQPPAGQGQPPVKNKKGTSSLTKSSQPYLTRNEALVARSQKQ